LGEGTCCAPIGVVRVKRPNCISLNK
jgi:hypothetical protein